MTLSSCQPGSREETSSSWVWPDWRRRSNATILKHWFWHWIRIGFYCKLSFVIDFCTSISHFLILRWNNVTFLSTDLHLCSQSAFIGPFRSNIERTVVSSCLPSKHENNNISNRNESPNYATNPSNIFKICTEHKVQPWQIPNRTVEWWGPETLLFPLVKNKWITCMCVDMVMDHGTDWKWVFFAWKFLFWGVGGVIWQIEISQWY